MKHKILYALAGTMTFSLAACATDPNTGQRIYGNTATGAAAGAIIGAGLGTMAGGDDKRNAAIGAVVGAIAGSGIGVYMDKQEAAMRAATRDTGIEVQRVEDQLLLTMPSDVTFKTDDASIQPQFYDALNQVSTTLKQFPQTAVDIIGHADSRGSDAYNQALSERRAQSVMNYLQAQGVNSVRMVAYGMGESQPIADNSTPEGQAKNRRVEIVLTPITEQ